MPRFSQESISRLREVVDIVDLISRYVPLKKNGINHKGLCPFHSEKTPSFTVNKSSNHYHCFGCGAHGDSVSFIMAQEGLSFSQTLQFLAERYNVVLDVVTGEPDEVASKQVLRSMLDSASKFFQLCLHYAPEAGEARSYLQARGFSLSFIRTFGIGYAPGHYALRQFLLSQGYTLQQMELGGLITQRHHDFFAERITFPVLDTMGCTVGFSARKWKESTFGGKYINTPETPLFKKSKLLFGLSYSKKRIMKDRLVCLVEGQIDALRLIAAGFDYTVATLGTAFGMPHVEQFKALGVREVFIAFDQDDAGWNSAQKAGALLLKHGIGARIVVWDHVKDPDELVQRHGVVPFFEAICVSMDYIPFLIQRSKLTSNWKVPQEKDTAIRSILEIIHTWTNPILVHESIKQLAAIAEVPDSCLGSDVQVAVDPLPVMEPSAGIADIAIELELVRWLIGAGYDVPEVMHYCQSHVKDHDFISDSARSLFFEALNKLAQKQPVDFLQLAQTVDIGPLADVVDRLLLHRPQLDKALSIVKELIMKIQQRNWLARREAIRMKMQRPDATEDELLALAKEFDALKTELPNYQ